MAELLIDLGQEAGVHPSRSAVSAVVIGLKSVEIAARAIPFQTHETGIIDGGDLRAAKLSLLSAGIAEFHLLALRGLVGELLEGVVAFKVSLRQTDGVADFQT